MSYTDLEKKVVGCIERAFDQNDNGWFLITSIAVSEWLEIDNKIIRGVFSSLLQKDVIDLAEHKGENGINCFDINLDAIQKVAQDEPIFEWSFDKKKKKEMEEESRNQRRCEWVS